MTTLDPKMRGLALDASAAFRLRNPMRRVDADLDFFRAMGDTVDDAEVLLDAGLLDEGCALLFWAPFLLAAYIGYDGRVVDSLGSTVADFVDREEVKVADEELIRLGESLGIHEPDQYFGHADRAATSQKLWGLAIEQVRKHTRPYGLKLAFWVMCIRACEYDLTSTRISAAVREAARTHRDFASGC
jgi:hypothetical protein